MNPNPHAIWVAGASGLVGQALLAQLPAATALVRRPLAPGMHRGLAERMVDFQQLAQGRTAGLPAPGTVYCALGTTIKQAGSQAAFKAVDLDAVLAVAQAAKACGAQCFAVVSALGADPHSSVFYNRVKGEMEAAVAALGFARTLVARPSLLLGNRAALGQPLRPMERLAAGLSTPMQWLVPASVRPIAAATVARALVRAVEQPGQGFRIIESTELQRLGSLP